MTRIISGAARGRRLAVPPRGTRPTSDRVRESVFSTLTSLLSAEGRAWREVRVLDLYAGTGALGLEALSRGAASVTLVESDRAAARVLRSNCEVVGLPGATVVERRVGSLGRAAEGHAPADLVFADPPYDVTSEVIAQELGQLSAHEWIAPGALLVVERPDRESTVPLPQEWTILAERRYGDTRLWYGRGGSETADRGSD